ncbi:hypothetical protein CsatA_008637 [Cannabis sativa]
MVVIIESAPKLASFWYKGNVKFSISMVEESSNLLNGTFIIHVPENYDGNWFVSLMKFFLNLNCPWNTALIFPEDMKTVFRSPLVNWEHIKVFTRCNPERELQLRDTLHWISPCLKTFSVNEGT